MPLSDRALFNITHKNSIGKSVNEYWMGVAIAVNQKSEIVSLWVHLNVRHSVGSQMNGFWLPASSLSHTHLSQRTKLLIMVITSTRHCKYVSMFTGSAWASFNEESTLWKRVRCKNRNFSTTQLNWFVHQDRVLYFLKWKEMQVNQCGMKHPQWQTNILCSSSLFRWLEQLWNFIRTHRISPRCGVKIHVWLDALLPFPLVAQQFEGKYVRCLPTSFRRIAAHIYRPRWCDEIPTTTRTKVSREMIL